MRRGYAGGESRVFFNDTATTEIYTLSLHDALPILRAVAGPGFPVPGDKRRGRHGRRGASRPAGHGGGHRPGRDRKSTRLNSSHANISYAVFCLKKKNSTSQFTSFSSLSHLPTPQLL